ncbi:EamA family transporter RarD [Bacillus salacetis]|uniref:EamA family transporter RarD n=1 Tax=Bacillus salacetis TaxID=2315464 RepID=A0A3A1QLB0_9BACI|nr:EamA family transporter RarD [Bacillus salacetis]
MKGVAGIRTEEQAGILYTAFSYFLWGILPIYWKWLNHVPADEILANRIFWSFWFMIVFLIVIKKFPAFWGMIKGMMSTKKKLAALAVASLLVSANWFIYIWAVNTDQMVEASLGYYINPLVSVLLGVFILREKMTKAQAVSFVLAAIGVIILTASYGRFPWIAVGLAVSFGLYGLAKKLIKVDSDVGLTLETLTTAPFALIYLIYLSSKGDISLFHVSAGSDLLLIGAGAVTAVPLLYFAKGAQRIPLYMVGFLQYIAPTLTLILGVFLYGEPFTQTHLAAFAFIWSALTVFSVSRMKMVKRKRKTEEKCA